MTPERWDLDLGDGHWLSYAAFAPNRELNPQYADLPDTDKVAATVDHLKPDGSLCSGFVTFDVPQATVFAGHARWQVESWDPLTLSPSLLCHCGDHGYIRNGRWERVPG